jgi:hypothetical protein
VSSPTAAPRPTARRWRTRTNHPFVGQRIAVVVNGITANYREIAEANDLRLDSQCDSEIVLRLVEAQRDVAAGLNDCLAQVEGGMAVVVLDMHRRSVWLARNEARPAWVLRLSGVHGYFACSTREIAEEALCRAFGRCAHHLVELLVPLASGVPVEMSQSGMLISARPHLESVGRVSRSLRVG